ncbi:hypothetical protein Tco_0868758 [Tanacetum coccineum]
MQTQEDHSNTIQALNVDALKVDLVVKQNTCSGKENSTLETAFEKPVKESSLDSETKDVHAIKYKMSKAKERCMTYFRSLHSHLHVLSKEDLKGTRIEHGFKRAFMSLFGQDDDTFTSTMLLNVDQLQKQLDKHEFQEDGSMAAFWVINIQDTLLQHMGNVKKSVAERTRHKRQYERRLNKRRMQTQESKIDTGKAVHADLVVIESSRTESEVQDDSRRSGNDTNADDADIRPIYDKGPMAEVQLTAECNIFAIRQQHTEQPKIINDGRVDQITQHYFPKRRESAFAKPDHMIASSESRNSSKNMPRFSSNDMLHNHYLDEARKNTQERDRNSKTSVMPSARFQSTTDDSKPKPRSTNHLTRSLPVSKSSCVTITVVSIADHSKNSNSFSEFYMSDMFVLHVISIFTGHRFFPNKTSAVYEKISPRYDLRWKPTGRIFKTIGLRWVPTGKILASCTSKDDSEPTHGSNVDIPNIHECKQTLDLSASTSLTGQQKQRIDFSAVDSQMMKQKNDVLTQQFKPRTLMSNDV